MPRYLEFEVSLQKIEPRIWRRMLLPEDATFLDLHQAIQDAGGWEDYHLFEFWRPKGSRDRIPIAGPPSDEDGLWDGEMDVPDAAEVRLRTCFARAGTKCAYTYDFGDNWRLDVKLRRTVELDEEFPRRLLDGARAFPPEDCGGVYGYYDCLEAVERAEASGDEDADEDDAAARRNWLGDWSPEFDLAAAKERFDHPETYRGRIDDEEGALPGGRLRLVGNEDEDDELDDEDELDEEDLLDLFKDENGEFIVDPDAEGATAGLAIMEAVSNQLDGNDPPEARQAYERLTKAGHSSTEAKRMIACALSVELFEITKSGKPHEPKRYADLLARLPDLGFLDE